LPVASPAMEHCALGCMPIDYCNVIHY